MPMKIEVCDNCGGVVALDTCENCGLDWKTANITTVHTTAELKQAKIEAYQDVLDACNKTESLDCIKDFIEEKIYSVETKMEV